MSNVTAVVSMLHESATTNSATRQFRNRPVLDWTLQRLSMSSQVGSVTILCWDDQERQVRPLAAERDAQIINKGPRTNPPSLQAITAARRWADGWRGGLLSTCDFDSGFYAPAIKQLIDEFHCDAVLLIDPAAALVDPRIIDDIIEHADARPAVELCFTQAAPGLAGALLRPTFVERLIAGADHPGRALHYMPDQPVRDPIGGDGCVKIPATVSRSTQNFRLDSSRQISRIASAAANLNGELLASCAEDLVERLNWPQQVDSLPREVVLELNTNRNTSPIHWPGKYHEINRPPLLLASATRIFEQLAAADDMRLTLAGVGDPLLHPQFGEIVAAARSAGITAIHVETDLLGVPSAQLVQRDIGVISVHLPAMTAQTYAAVMGVDRFGEAIENIKQFVVARHQQNRRVPIMVPTFTKCQANLAEMEIWYDQWIKALGSAAITGPSDYAGLIPDHSLADMSPPRRRPCGRLWSRMTILCDGRVVSCEQDVTGRQVIGDAATQLLTEIWQNGFEALRTAHTAGRCGGICTACREWHRP